MVKVDGKAEGSIRVAYQTRRAATWSGSTTDLAGRTLEEAFALQNLAWTQDLSRRALGLYMHKSDQMTLEQLHTSIFKRVRNLDKTKFALGLMADQDATWVTPYYIVDGLVWLRDRLEIAATSPAKPLPGPEATK